ncbi:MAG: TolC family protein [Kofleriaceae bacterium]|nr:TolC family protein [Kofleriaceae bacterium]
MSRQWPALAAVLSLTLSSQLASARPITLTEALSLADRSPALTAAEAQVDAARGSLEQSEIYPYNPVLGGSFGPARSRGMTFYDYDVGLSQTIELGGKRRARVSAAAAERDAAVQTLAWTKAVLHAEVRRAFQEVLVAQSRVTVATEAETFARELREAALERLRLGAATQTEVNVAIANLGRSIVAKRTADRDLILAQRAFGDAMGVVGTGLEPVGALPTFPVAPSDEKMLVDEAISTRPDLIAAYRTRAARSAAVDLADAQAVPDPQLSVSWVRSAVEDSSSIVVGAQIALPLVNRNQGNRHAARAALKRATIERDAARLAIERDVRTTRRRYQAASEAVAAFDQQVVGKLGENLKLAREMLAAGKLGLLELNTVRRDLVESQLSYLDAIGEAVEARAALERALGRSLEVMP